MATHMSGRGMQNRSRFARSLPKTRRRWRLALHGSAIDPDTAGFSRRTAAWRRGAPVLYPGRPPRPPGARGDRRGDGSRRWRRALHPLKGRRDTRGARGRRSRRVARARSWDGAIYGARPTSTRGGDPQLLRALAPRERADAEPARRSRPRPSGAPPAPNGRADRRVAGDRHRSLEAAARGARPAEKSSRCPATIVSLRMASGSAERSRSGYSAASTW